MHSTVEAAGLILLTRARPIRFLLLQHPHRWDLPKGHLEPGESLLQAALRETEEETGIPACEIEVDPRFRFQLQYPVQSRNSSTYLKQVSYFLGYVERDRDVVVTEHTGFAWYDWPPGKIQSQTIDPLLDAVRDYFESQDPSTSH